MSTGFTRYFGVVPFNDVSMGLVNVPDLTKWVNVAEKYKSNDQYVLKYTLRPGDRLDQIAKRLYEDESLWFLIMVANDWVSIDDNWPLNDEEFNQYLINKYPFNEASDVHHYTDQYGNVIDPYAYAIRMGIDVLAYISRYQCKPVTIWDYEYQLNEAKKDIVLFDPDLVDNIKQDLLGDFPNVNGQ